MSAEPARFTFDLDLGDNPSNATFMSDAARTLLQQQARSAGYAEGVVAGETGTTAAAAQGLALAANAIADRAAQLLAGLDAARHAAEHGAVALAASVGRKLATNLLAREPTAELEALLAECLASLAGAPHLVIRCHPDLADKLREIAAQRVAASGFAGRLIVMGEPDITLGDGRVEWADGGLVRDAAQISDEIDRAIAGYLAARSGNLTPKETAP